MDTLPREASVRVIFGSSEKGSTLFYSKRKEFARGMQILSF